METNIQLLHSARRALETIQAVSGESRDGTIRRLLEEHVESQEKLPPELRVSHISTLMRHPLPPADRREAYPASPLRVRVSSDLADRARSLSLQLPGQPPRRGGRDYQARPLTDAIVTAIARRERIRDPFLDGLKPLLRHGAADGLWRLAVAATATRTEIELFTRYGNPFATGDRVAQELLFNQVAWHGKWRLDVLRRLARHYLAESNADAAEAMLLAQGNEFELTWFDLLNRTGEEDDGMGSLPGATANYEGRAGGAVWRAERATEKVETVDWLASRDGEQVRRVTPPGWELQLPGSWVGAACRVGSPELDRMQPWIEGRQVLQLPAGTLAVHLPPKSLVLIWPLRVTTNGVHSPVPRLDVVLEALGTMPSVAAAELLLRDHRYAAAAEDETGLDVDNEVPWPNPDDDDDLLDLDPPTLGLGGTNPDDRPDQDDGAPFWGAIEVPAYVARRLGLIDEPTFLRLLADAESETRRRMAEALAALPPELADDELREATSFPAKFNDLLYLRGVERGVREKKPRWSWPVISLADQLEQGASGEVLGWLARELRWRYDHELWASEYEAWRAASARYDW